MTQQAKKAWCPKPAVKTKTRFHVHSMSRRLDERAAPVWVRTGPGHREHKSTQAAARAPAPGAPSMFHPERHPPRKAEWLSTEGPCPAGPHTGGLHHRTNSTRASRSPPPHPPTQPSDFCSQNSTRKRLENILGNIIRPRRKTWKYTGIPNKSSTHNTWWKSKGSSPCPDRVLEGWEVRK